MTEPRLRMRKLNESYPGRFSIINERASEMAMKRAKLLEDGLYRLFKERHGLNGLAEIQEFMKTHVCEWHLRSPLTDPVIERFRIDDHYVGEFRMEWVTSEISVSCRMSWIPYVYPILMEGCEPWE